MADPGLINQSYLQFGNLAAPKTQITLATTQENVLQGASLRDNSTSIIDEPKEQSLLCAPSKHELHITLSQNIMEASKRQLKMPSYVFQPLPRLEGVTALMELRQQEPDLEIRLEFEIPLPVFR